MPDKWDRFSGAVQRAFDDMPYEEVRVYNYTESYDSNTGNSSWTRSEDVNSPIQANVVDDANTGVRQEPSGDDSEGQVDILIPDDTGVTLVAAGEDDAKPTTIEPTNEDVAYTVVDTAQLRNGLIQITAREQ
jgi:hypothetical protein